jgi:translation initiation factor 3 subunit L
MTSRAECLFGDYHSCLKHVEVIAANESDGSLGKQAGLFMTVPMCYVIFYYHQGFAQMMMRRYVDAIKSFSSVITYISRNKQALSGDQTGKLSDKMLALLSACVVFCPGQRLDDAVGNQLRDKYGDTMKRMERGESSAFEEVFSYAHPKFILPCVPNYDQPLNYNQDAFQVQVRVFSQEVAQQEQMPKIRSYLKLYRSIGIEKLARFNDTELDAFRTQLLALKHKSFQLQTDRSSAALTEGKRAAASDVHFFVSGDMVHIDETRSDQRFGDHFISHMHKFEDVITDVSRMR